VRIRLGLSGRTFFLWFGGLFLLVGLGLLYGGIQEARRERAYRLHSEVVDAVVTGKSIQRASREGNSSTRYEVAYRFIAPDGRPVEGVDVVSVEEWELLGPGSRLKVAYLPASPETSRAARSDRPTSAIPLIVLGGALATAGGAVFVRTAAKLRRERRLLRDGMPAQGTILAIEPSNVSVNRVRQWNVRYRYADHLGRSHEGRSGPIAPEDAHAVTVGGVVEVRFDRAAPDESVWVRPPAVRRPAFWTKLRNFAATLVMLLVAVLVGEVVPPLKSLDGFAARHESLLVALTIGIAVIGFMLFMGGILYRLFADDGGPVGTEDAEPAGSTAFDAEPVVARLSAYRFRGRSAGASASEGFTLREAVDAWRRRAWRTSPRWRANFIVTAGVALFVIGLFGFFAIGAPAGIKLLFIAAIVYALVRLRLAIAQVDSGPQRRRRDRD
jgi:hypothetical protein